MAKITISAIPYVVTAGDTSNNELNIEKAFPAVGLVAKLTVISGTFKFNNIGNASESNASYTDDESVLLTIIDGFNLSYQANSGADTFRIEI